MKTAIERYKSGDFNDCAAEHLPDGSYIYVLTKEGEEGMSGFRARNLCQPDEEIISQVEIPTRDQALAFSLLKGGKKYAGKAES